MAPVQAWAGRRQGAELHLCGLGQALRLAAPPRAWDPANVNPPTNVVSE